MSTLPMADLFRACVDVLDAEMVPLHYRDLTERAVRRMGSDPSDLTWHRQVEDVREKLLDADRLGTAYVPAPHCLAVLGRWFSGAQLDLLNAESIAFDTVPRVMVQGATEAAWRAPHMITKQSNDSRRVALGRARGLILEAHVDDFFRSQWPDFIRAAPNVADPRAWCSFDFILAVPGHRPIRVDVAGRRLNGGFDPAPNKPKADLHLLCDFIDEDYRQVRWLGVSTPDRFVRGVFPEAVRSPVRMAVWLNTLKAGLPYDEIAEAVRLRGAA